jgi:hypothetical protein
MKQHAPATARNREPIREVLAKALPSTGTVLEIASGSGEHAVAFAGAFPALTWQPTDPSPAAVASIAAHRAEAELPNLAAPFILDVHADWTLERADAIACINMIHIAPWTATLALFAGASRLLVRDAPLFLYGPYIIDGETAPSNRQFDQSLRSRDPSWGVRELGEVKAVATDAGFALVDLIVMPANNHSLVFRRG